MVEVCEAMVEMADEIEAVAFDVFGTVMDWHTGIAVAVADRLPQVEPGEFARRWRAGYRPALERVEASGEWKNFGPIHRELLDDLLEWYDLAGVSDGVRDDLTAAWRRLDPWPDVGEALIRLRSRYTVTTLSNGDVEMLTEMARRVRLPFDRVLGCDLFGHYKPAPEVYLGAVELLALRPEQVLMVAAHEYDLEAAAECGMRTAYVERAREFGADRLKDVSSAPGVALHVGDIGALADQLGC